MALKEKYSELITAAYATGIANLEVKEQNGRLYINGFAPTEIAKQKLKDLYETLKTTYQTGEVIMNIKFEPVAE